MNQDIVQYAARLRAMISRPQPALDEPQFAALAGELFRLQFQSSPAYRRICEARRLTPATVDRWTQIPAAPTSAFKDLELSGIPAKQRTAVFHSSCTTGQKPSRHFHCAESLALYETSLWHWFKRHFNAENELIFLTPDATAAPRSSLVHMFETVGRPGAGDSRGTFCGRVTDDDSWTVDFDRIVPRLESASANRRPVTLLGTAFSFVHLLDRLAETGARFALAAGSQVMETGGYKNRSRVLPKAELHGLITSRLGVEPGNIVCEYGMSELSSQAYDAGPGRHFHFPPWARARMMSPETGGEVGDGGTGLIRVFDLANVFSVASIQTEDLGVRHGDGFELMGRAQLAEPRGCSLLAA